ncbi:MAG TPA: SAM-dependent methyltransferase [Thermococcus sp.]|nr:SAM-dependent methyltransferase [Thermococcus sp.]
MQGMKRRKREHNRYYGTIDETGLRRYHEKVLQILSNYKCDKLLDIGCGDGSFTILIGKTCEAKEVYGVEISEKAVKFAEKRGIKVFQLDIDEEDFPFEDNYFDAIFAGEIIEHLYNPDHLLEEVYRILKNKGIFLITTPNLASFYNRVSLLLGYQPFYTNVSIKKSIGHLIEFEYFKERDIVPFGDHIRLFTLRSLKEMLKSYGFKIKSVQGSTATALVFWRFSFLIKFLDRILEYFPSLSTTLIIVAQKEIQKEIL